MSNVLAYLVIAVCIGIIVFFIMRSFNLWYWKINEHIKLQQLILNELRIANGRKTLNFTDINMDYYKEDKEWRSISEDRRVVRDDTAERYYGKGNDNTEFNKPGYLNLNKNDKEN
jgi:hypothetical protein